MNKCDPLNKLVNYSVDHIYSLTIFYSNNQNMSEEPKQDVKKLIRVRHGHRAAFTRLE